MTGKHKSTGIAYGLMVGLSNDGLICLIVTDADGREYDYPMRPDHARTLVEGLIQAIEDADHLARGEPLTGGITPEEHARGLS